MENPGPKSRKSPLIILGIFSTPSFDSYADSVMQDCPCAYMQISIAMAKLLLTRPGAGLGEYGHHGRSMSKENFYSNKCDSNHISIFLSLIFVGYYFFLSLFSKQSFSSHQSSKLQSLFLEMSCFYRSFFINPITKPDVNLG